MSELTYTSLILDVPVVRVAEITQIAVVPIDPVSTVPIAKSLVLLAIGLVPVDASAEVAKYRIFIPGYK